MAARSRRRRVRRVALPVALGRTDRSSAPRRCREQPVTWVSWFAAQRLLRSAGRAPADLVGMGIRRRGRRDARATRAATRPGANASSPGIRGRRTRRLPRAGCRRPTPTACRTCTAWSGNGPTTTPRCWCPPTTATRATPTSEVLRRRRAVDERPRQLRGADAGGDAVLARRRQHHRQPRLPLRAVDHHEIRNRRVGFAAVVVVASLLAHGVRAARRRCRCRAIRSTSWPRR